jgi:FkbM family methyltransferase
MFNLALGMERNVNGRNFFVTEKGKFGCAVYGPYKECTPGRYLAEFYVAVETNDGASSVCGSVDITTDLGQTLITEMPLFTGRLRNAAGRVVLPFVLSRPTTIEARVISNGYESLHIDMERVIRPLSEGELGYLPITDASIVSDTFFLNNFNHFRHIYDNGGEVSFTDHGPVVSMKGVSFFVKNREDIQIANEVFIGESYGFRSHAPKVVVDIGMNVGLASLRMACDPTVLEVHAFEPFSAPFARALENFALNPETSPKIIAQRKGLADGTSEAVVLVDDNFTVTNSLKGRETGHPDPIHVLDSGDALQPIIARARQLGADVFVKLDCEGSEFAIFKSLGRKGLLKDIRGFLVEWHKWWSADKSSADLIDPLLANEFVVLDRTREADLWAGQFNAIRVSR